MNNSANKTFEIALKNSATFTLRATVEGVLEYLRPGHGELKAVKRGYTTWRLYQNGLDIGSFQDLG